MKRLTFLSFFSLCFCFQLAVAQSSREILYVGTYSVRGSEGIYTFAFDRKSGTLQPLATTSNDKSPSFLAIHPNGRFLYSVNEGAEKAGGVSAYAIEPGTGKLTFLNQESSQGSGPCHISIDQTGRMAFVSNYGGGTFTVLPIGADGKLGSPVENIRYTGSGPNAQRQDKPHIHSATVSPDNRFVYVADLGTDKLYTYEIDAKAQKIKPAATPFVSITPGGGPRHFAIHPNGKNAYLVAEMGSATVAFNRDPKTGALTILQESVKTLPAEFTGNNTSADIHTDPAGRFLYQSNRGHNALAIMSIAGDGKLTLVGHQPVGEVPRNFMVDPKGDFVLAANQNSDSILIFKRDKATGKLSQVGEPVKVPSPVCLKLMTLK
ncbi:lactonase family protein [Tellurirhabdus rosea]|uniref:lactonase family protein n=1 Tax=Tellurirhabdus rosea TaxID=2674997 RepID=UPI00225227F5|nr:lactonase family protein [Tellurirhabdus rosea]